MAMASMLPMSLNSHLKRTVNHFGTRKSIVLLLFADVMTNIARTISHLTKVIAEIEEHANTRVKYEDVPYVVEVILLSYLPYW
jgi:hypothetical protein